MSEQKNQLLRLPLHTMAILFDLDDTLYSRDKTFRAWARTFMQTHAIVADSTSTQDVLEHLIELDGYGFTPRSTFFTTLRATYPSVQPTNDQLVEAFYDQFHLHLHMEAAMEPLLHALRDAQIPFGIITNGSIHQQKKIDALGLGQLTSCIFISQVFGAQKPDPAIFLAAAACLGVDPEKVLFVGDHPTYDIWGARSVGMKTVWIERFHAWPESLARDTADITVTSLTELCTLLGIPPAMPGVLKQR